MDRKLAANKPFYLVISAIAILFWTMLFNTDVYAKQKMIPGGITIGDIDISGMSEQDAVNRVNEYMATFTNQSIELDMDGNKVNLTVGELGYYWKNTEIINQAASFCEEGNVISRYKMSKDIEQNGVKYELEIDVNDEVLRNTINEKCGVYNIPHKNAQLTKTGDSFSISQESSGRMIDMDTSIANIHNYLLNEWDGNATTTQTLVVVDDYPVATVADCQRVKDLLGTYSTRFSVGSSSYSRNKNIENGAKLLNGITLCQGETMSVNSFLEPWTRDNGWHEGGTYVNGRVENSLGGGICQVSTTLYNAALNAELEIVERFNHSMSVDYVPLSMDAALAGTWKDLKLKNNTNTPVYIEAIYDSTGKIIFNIYGEETRPANRRVEYVSETISTTPSSEVVKQDPNLPSGYRAVTSGGHTGYKARLWKKVYVDNVLQSEEIVNTSSYSPSPTYVTIGTGATQPVPEQPTDVPVEQPTTPPQTPAQQETPTQQETSAQQETPVQQETPTQPQIQKPSGGSSGNTGNNHSGTGSSGGASTGNNGGTSSGSNTSGGTSSGTHTSSGNSSLGGSVRRTAGN